MYNTLHVTAHINRNNNFNDKKHTTKQHARNGQSQTGSVN